MTKTTDTVNLGLFQKRSFIVEQTLAFASRANFAREVLDFYPNFKRNTKRCVKL